jgi:hemolysin activation/secretion protein
LATQAQDAGARLQNLQNDIGQRRAEPKPATPPKKRKNDVKPEPTAQGKLWVKAFKVTGITLIDQAQAQAAVSEYLGKELTFDQIQEAGRVVADLYGSMGRVATSVIPEQDVVDATVEIRIIEAKAGSVLVLDVVEGSNARLSKEVAKSFISQGNVKGQILNLDNLNRSKVLLNELPGISADVALTKSKQDGSSDLLVTVAEGPLVTGRADLSNSGSASTGVAQNIWSLNLNNTIGFGDQLALDAALSQGSTFTTFKYWMPVGYDGWRVAPSVSALKYKTLQSFSDISSAGNANVVGLFSTYALQRGSGNTHSLNFSLENKQYQNFTNDTEASAYKIAKLTAGVSGALMQEKQNLSYAINAGLGNLSINNAAQLSTDASASGPQTAGRYSKLSLYTSLVNQLPLKRTTLRTTFNGQVASKNLNSSEQIYLGGSDSVRAYPVAQGGGSQGFVASLEVTHTFTSGLQLGVFYDLGRIQQYKNNWSPVLQGSTKAGNIYALRSAGLSARYAWDNFQVQAALAYRLGDNPLHSSTGAQLNSDNAYRSVQAWVKGSYSFN